MSSTFEFPGFEQLFLANSSGGRREFVAKFLDPDERKLFRELTRGEVDVDRVIHFRHHMGGATPTDVVWVGGKPMVVSNGCLDALQQSGVTGWKSLPALIRDKKKQVHENYHVLCVTGRCGEIDNDRAVPVDVQFPARVSRQYKGLYFYEGSWDGSDIFCFSGPRKPTFMYMTQAAKNVFVEHEFKCIDFKPLSELLQSPIAVGRE